MNFFISSQEFLYIVLLSIAMSLFMVISKILLVKVLKDNSDREIEVINLDNQNFSNSIITNGEFIDLSCRNSIFYRTNLTNAIFKNMDLTGSDFTGAILENTQFIDCVMINVQIEPREGNNYILVNTVVENREIYNPELN